ncbi:leucine-rich repeat-containing protein 61 [Exaiptasia diaphana]|uniref:Leucine-rich repeat-containing protein 61 n=1 Tax=Exaiptasia diaphana TaxID=2652724 RepID=A0A913Y4Y7_EXADI|nr:leucine-rich repeat-containing protein 61 [Exaiptasia diaphana]KXJ22637.1 Leucine-rich repeat-containing protein 61 [Exaiptasia diaphana]
MTRAKKEEVSAHFLKLKSGEFDLESIHHLDLSDMGIQDLSIVGNCAGMVYLNLSHNRIKSLKPLGDLKLLERLDVSCNNISALDGISDLEGLISLNLAGNMIMSIEDLKCLSKLSKLRKLRLKDDVHNYSNPVCQSASNYKKSVSEVLPQLTTLDGEILQGKGSDVYKMCDEVDDALKECAVSFGDAFAYKSVPWQTGIKSDKAPNRSVEEAELGFNEVLSLCKKANDEAMKSVMDADTSRWTS